MSASKRSLVNREDLIYRARSGQLTDDEHQELIQLLETSATLRVAYQLGRDFDAVDSVVPGDDLMIARVSEHVVRSANRSFVGRILDTFSSSARRRTAWVAAALLFGASAAAAIAIGTARWRFGTHPPVQSAPSAKVSAMSALQVRAVLPIDTQVAVPEDLKISKSAADAEPSSRVAALGSQSAPDRGSVPLVSPSLSGAHTNSGSSVGDKTDGAESLFRRANIARRHGQLGQAIALYTNLQAHYSDTTEAKLSHISLAKLLLASGRAAEADTQFAQYLAQGGPLDLEALVGRAESQRQLGHVADERTIWRQVLDRFPSSVHAMRARQRLAALGDVAR